MCGGGFLFGIKCGHFWNRSVQRVARNREYPKGVNHVPGVVWSCIKMHATYEIMNYALRLIIRATSCTLRTKSWITHRS